jgi:hypothetical protein
MTKLLVATGQISGTSLASVEIINLDDPNLVCDNLPDLAVSIIAPTGQLFAKQLPIICGGTGSKLYCNCHSYGNQSWQSIPSLRECKFGSASADLANPNMNETNIILVTGGHNGSLVSTVESYDGKQWNQTMFVQLPEAVFYHCLVKINNTMLLQMGGSHGGGAAGGTKNTYFFDTVQNKWISGKS